MNKLYIYVVRLTLLCGLCTCTFAQKNITKKGNADKHAIPNVEVVKAHSGPPVGEYLSSFSPIHAFGPDKGSTACPVCKYGSYFGVMFFVGTKPNWPDIKKWLVYFDKLSTDRGKYLKVYFVYGNDSLYSKEVREKELETLGKELQLRDVALTFVPSFMDVESEVNTIGINPTLESTFIIYQQVNIIEKYIDFKPTPKNFKIISALIDKSKFY